MRKETVDWLEGSETLSSVLNVNAYSDVSTNWVKNYGTEYQIDEFVSGQI